MPVVFASRGASRACAAVVAGAVSVALVMGGSAANAEEPGLVGAAAEAVLAGVAPEVLENIADVEVGDEVVSYTENGVTAEVPLDASEPLGLSSEGDGISVQLPFGDEAGLVESEDPGVVVFDNGNDSTSAVVVHDDSSVQVNTIIESSDAPTRYDYAVTVPDGGRLAPDETGAVAVLDAEGQFVAGVAAPWAKDANGVEVPTRYEVSGSTLTQVVEHSVAYAYPITADPWFGIDLIKSFKWVKSSQGYTISVSVTPWMGAVAEWIAIGPGWDELKTKVKRRSATEFSRLNTVTMLQQWTCHAIGKTAIGIFGFIGLDKRPSWDLENWRKANPGYAKAFKTQCNW